MLNDLRYGIRMLVKKRVFTAVVVLTLGLGIGANTALFSIVNAVLLRPLPYKDADRLVAVWESEVGHGPNSKVFASFRDFQEWKDHSHSFEQLEACTWAWYNAGQTLMWHGTAQRVTAIPTTAGLFSLLGVQAAQGRTFKPSDLKSGCTVVLSHGFWQSRLAGMPDLVGSSVTLDDQACSVVGIMPKGFDFYPKQTNLWTLIMPHSEFERQPLDSAVGVFGRLKPDVSITKAQAELAVLHQQVVHEAPPGTWVSQFVPVIYSLREEFTWLAGRNLRTALLVLFAAVVCVLLIACVNVANLQVARTSERQKELAVRAALGSGRSRLVRQLLTESLLFTLLGAALGVILAVASVGWFRSTNLVELPPGNPVTVNLLVLVFTGGLAILAGLLSGLLPAWKASRIDLNEALKETSRGLAQGALSHRTTRLFVVAEVALSLILLAGAALLIQSLARLNSVPLGFRPDHLLTARVTLPTPSYPRVPQRAGFYDNLISSLSTLPAVEEVALSSSLPPGGGYNALTVAGKAAPSTELGDVGIEEVSADYFRVVRIPLLRGRHFELTDGEHSQPAAIVNEALAREYFPNEDPLGRQIRLGKPDDKAPWLTIIGTVGNVKGTTVYKEMGYEEFPLVYRPLSQSAGGSMVIFLRTTGYFAGLAAGVQREVSALDSTVPVHDVKTIEERISESLAHPRFRAILLGIFAGLALLLAAVGIYGVLSETTLQRTHEIGIRMALGAKRRDVLRLVVRQGLVLALGGAVIGLVAALAVTRFLASMLYGVKPTDPQTLVVVSLLLIGVATLASYIPARRATKVDPMVALRYE
jgi:putative ABC transport system permease protein